MRSLLILLVCTQKGLASSSLETDSEKEYGNQVFESTVAYPCGENQYGMEGTIRSPNYPNEYPANVDCEWTAQVDGEDTDPIYVTVMNFDMGTGDYLEIRDGRDSSSELLAKFTGQNKSVDVTSTGDWMYFYFHSDDSNSAQGFELYWNTNIRYHECGGYFYDDAGTLTSPYYHHYYPQNCDCEWTLIGPEGSTITVEIEDFNTELGYDYLGFFDGYDGPMDGTLANLSGQPLTYPPIVSTDNVMEIVFESDEVGRESGFKLNWFLTGHRPTAKPSTPPPAGLLQCYSCIGCDTITEDTSIVTSEDSLTCFVAIELGVDHFVARGGSPDYYEDGFCHHEADGAIVCYCTANLCNDDEALKQLRQSQ